MMRYFRIYKTFVRANFAELITYKANLFNNILGSVLWGVVNIILMFFLTSKTNQVFGWTRNEILLLTGVLNIFISIFYFLFSRNFDRFSPIIHQGQLDSILLRPVDSQFLMSFTYVNFSGALRIVLGIGFTIFILLRMNYLPSVTDIVSSFVFLVCGVMIMYSIWYIISTLLIWWTNLSNISGLLYEFNSFMRFPQRMYEPVKILFYVIFPLTLVVTVPTRLLLGEPEVSSMVFSIVFAGGLLIISRLFWKFALRFYTSASG